MLIVLDLNTVDSLLMNVVVYLYPMGFDRMRVQADHRRGQLEEVARRDSVFF